MTQETAIAAARRMLAALHAAHPELATRRTDPHPARPKGHHLTGIDCAALAARHGGAAPSAGVPRRGGPSITSPGFHTPSVPDEPRTIVCGPLRRRPSLMRHAAWDAGTKSRARYERAAMTASPVRRAAMLSELLRHEDATDD